MTAKLRVLFFVAAFGLSAYPEAHATLVKWTLNNVTFNDGATASGFFIVDTSEGELFVPPPMTPSEPGSILPGSFLIHVSPALFDENEGLPVTDYGPRFLGGSGSQEYGVEKNSFFDVFDIHVLAFKLRLNTDADLLHTTEGRFHVLPGPTDCAIFDDRCSGEWNLEQFVKFRQVSPGGALTATVVPEPSCVVVVLGGLALIGLRFRKRRLPSLPR
jgi:hypothetical protein